MLRKDRQKGDQKRHFPVPDLAEHKAHLAAWLFLHTVDLLVPGARQALLPEEFEREDDIGGGDRLVIGETGERIKGEFHPRAILRHLDEFGNVAVKRERLVPTPDHQAVPDIVGPECTTPPQAIGHRTLADKGIEAVERALSAKRDFAPFGCVRVGVGKVIEVRRQGWLALHGNPVHGLGHGDLRRKSEAEAEGDRRRSRAAKSKREYLSRHDGALFFGFR